MRHRLELLAAVLWIVGATSCSPADSAAPNSNQEETTPVVREILARMQDPPGAPGYDLTLVRYTIAPGAVLSPHIHPGVQLAAIESGTLSYRIISGTAVIHRNVDENGVPEYVDQITGPADTELRPGDAIAEVASLQHFGSNQTNQPVVIFATLITEAGSDLSVPISPPEGQ